MEEGDRLVFEPTEIWPAATTFRIKLAPELFSRQAKIETLDKEFRTAPFVVAISEAKYYVNPKDPAIKQITATLTFSHPVNRASLEKNLSLAMESGEQVFKDARSATGRCTFTYDKLDRIIYVRSVNVAVPKESGHAILIVPDLRCDDLADAPTSIIEPRADVLVPSVSDLFHIVSAQAVDCRPITEDEPEQALVLATSVGVKPERLAQAIHAWILPKPKKRDDANSDAESRGMDESRRDERGGAGEIDSGPADRLCRARRSTPRSIRSS